MGVSVSWNAIEAQRLAHKLVCPVVTRVDSDVWVIYGPYVSSFIHGGYAHKENAVRVARKLYHKRVEVHPEILQSVESAEVRLIGGNHTMDHQSRLHNFSRMVAERYSDD